MFGGIALSAGYLTWLLRAGPMTLSVLSALPAWTKFDPIPVLARAKQGDDEQKHSENNVDEQRARKILQGARRYASN